MEIITIPCLYDNYSYLFVGDDGVEAAVIDPSEPLPILREVESRGLELKSALCTHHHQDHIGGLDDILAEHPDLRVLGLREDVVRIPYINEALEDGEHFSICSAPGQLLHTPGHTTTGVVYHLGDNVFTGDTLFGAGCGRLFEGTPGQMMRSLERIITLGGPDTKLYFGHEYTVVNLNFAAKVEPDNQSVRERLSRVEKLRSRGMVSTPSSVTEEMQTNPFLRWTVPEIVKFLEQNCGLQSHAPEMVFAAIRELRNNFS